MRNQRRVPIAILITLAIAEAGCVARTSPSTPSSIPNRSAVLSTSSTTSPRPSSAPGGSPCSADELVVTTTTDRPSYRMGQSVTATVTVRNDARSACVLPTGSCLPQVVITDAEGAEVWNRAALQVTCTYGDPRTLAPGASTEGAVTWDGAMCAGREPDRCTGDLVPPGSYELSATWNTARSGSVTIVVTAGSTR